MLNLLSLTEVTPSDLALIIFGATGLSYIVTRSKLFKRIREGVTLRNKYLGELISCPKCFGFWAGLISCIIFFIGLKLLLVGFSSSLASYLVYLKDK
jgi:hypothetical protein